MAASDLAAAAAVTKQLFGTVHEMFDVNLKILNIIESGAQKMTEEGTEAKWIIHTGLNEGIGARAEGEDLPAAGRNRDAAATSSMKYQYASVEGTGQVFAQVKTNPATFVDWMQRELDTVEKSANRDLARQVYGDGTGTLAVISTTLTAANSVIVDDAHWLRRDMTFSILTQATLGNATPTQANSAILTVTAVNLTTNTVTFSGPATSAAVGSVLVRASSVNGVVTTNWKREWLGLTNFVSTTSVLHGIDPAVEPLWAAGYIENSVGTLSELDIDTAVSAINDQGGEVTDIITTRGVGRAWWNTLQGQRQFAGNEAMKGGVRIPVAMTVQGDIPFTLDRDAPKGTIYYLNKKELFLHRKESWHWLDRQGSMWQKPLYKDSYLAQLTQYSNLGCYRRNSFGKQTGVTEL